MYFKHFRVGRLYFDLIVFPPFSLSCSKFFFDTVGEGVIAGTGKPVSQEDKAKISQRINRFGKQGGFDANRKKLSIDDLVKSVVS